MKHTLLFASIMLSIMPLSLMADWGACNVGTVSDIGVQIQSKTDDADFTAFTLSAAGAALSGKTDAIGFATGQAKLKGDCEIVAQVTNISVGDQDSAGGGLMIRENFGPSSKFFAAGCTRGHGIRSYIRSRESGPIAREENCTDCNPPTWLKIVRQGDHFTSYKSMDGRIWLQINEGDVPMKKAVWVGAFATSGGGQPVAEIGFDHVVARQTAGQ
ncbi:MAG: hypothetical protein ABSE59_10100 [Opitutaceae bacterium]|jgi:hypothetical protein